MPKRVVGFQFRNIKRVMIWPRAVKLMAKKFPWTEDIPPHYVFTLWCVNEMSRDTGFVKQKQLKDQLAKMGRTKSNNELKACVTDGLVDKVNVMGSEGYRISPRGLEYMKLVERYIKYTRFDK